MTDNEKLIFSSTHERLLTLEKEAEAMKLRMENAEKRLAHVNLTLFARIDQLNQLEGRVKCLESKIYDLPDNVGVAPL